MLLTIIIFLIILSVLVIVHEAGHFAAAKRFGVQVEEFGLGFPPHAKTLYKSADGVKWTLNWLPLGGFVKLKGEDGQVREDPDSFAHKAPWKRITILSAGVLMNLLLAFVLLSAGYAIGWPQDLTNKIIPAKFIKEQNILIVRVEPDTPAALADIKRGDIIKKVNDQAFTELTQLQDFIKQKENQEITLDIVRDKQVLAKKLKPRQIDFHLKDKDKKVEIVQKVGIGVALGKMGIVRYPVPTALLLGVKNTFLYTGKIFAAFYNLLKDLIVTRKISADIGGPVMIAAISGKAARMGFIYIMQFVAILSLNLAILNILPIPALDGGRILFVLVEKFKGHAVSIKIENWFHLIGFWLLIVLTFLITARDIGRFQIWEKVKNIITS
jgi:regulator of sigma E protease